MNSFGSIYRLTSFGESHGPAVGGVIDGIPANQLFSLDALQAELDARRPGSDKNVSQRREPDKLVLLSGYLPVEGQPSMIRSLGTPIGFYVANSNQRSEDYEELRHVYRPNHADLTYDAKYGVRDWRGGGRASGRETIARVVYGAFAKQILARVGISVSARVTEIGGCSDRSKFDEMIAEARAAGDSLGGIVAGNIVGLPAGLGEPTFGKLQQMLASAMLSIGAVHGFDYGDGFPLASMRGTQAADEMDEDGFLSNHCGGILGGISTGQPIPFRVAFKPTPSISAPLRTVDDQHQPTTLQTKGRHDPCIALRGAVVVSAMAAATILDALLLSSITLFPQE